MGGVNAVLVPTLKMETLTQARHRRIRWASTIGCLARARGCTDSLKADPVVLEGRRFGFKWDVKLLDKTVSPLDPNDLSEPTQAAVPLRGGLPDHRGEEEVGTTSAPSLLPV